MGEPTLLARVQAALDEASDGVPDSATPWDRSHKEVVLYRHEVIEILSRLREGVRHSVEHAQAAAEKDATIAALTQENERLKAEAETPIGVAIELIRTELTRATKKFPTWPTDPLHAVAVVGEEVGELTQAVLQGVYEPEKNEPEAIKKEAVHAATMGDVSELERKRPRAVADDNSLWLNTYMGVIQHVILCLDLSCWCASLSHGGPVATLTRVRDAQRGDATAKESV